MFIRIETSSGMPITRQIAEQIRVACASGTLVPSQRLPSVRQLAQELAVNQNTILRVYERLTAEGLLERRHGDGTYVADSLPAGRLSAERGALKQELHRLVDRACALGLDARDIHKLVDTALSTREESSHERTGD